PVACTSAPGRCASTHPVAALRQAQEPPVEATCLTVFSVKAATSTGSAAGSIRSRGASMVTIVKHSVAALRHPVAALRQAQEPPVEATCLTVRPVGAAPSTAPRPTGRASV
ncbi:MAG: hypothetical protein LBS86_03310, partial [Treponema sp.]|nr:hypothetical protein [Treponema sp.]